MNHQPSVCADHDGRASPARPVPAARGVKLVVVATIAAAFAEVALNPTASICVIHFWMALFLAAATQGDRGGAESDPRNSPVPEPGV